MKSGLSMYADADLNLEVRAVVQPDGSTSTHAVVLRDNVVVILPLRWSDANELEVLLDEQHRDAVNDQHMTEAPNRRMESHERDPYLVARRICGEEPPGDTTAGKHLLMSDVVAAPAFTSERWHLFAGYDMRGAERKIAGRWRTLRKAMAELDNGLIRDAKTMLALLLLQRYHEAVGRNGQDQ